MKFIDDRHELKRQYRWEKRETLRELKRAHRARMRELWNAYRQADQHTAAASKERSSTVPPSSALISASAPLLQQAPEKPRDNITYPSISKPGTYSQFKAETDISYSQPQLAPPAYSS